MPFTTYLADNILDHILGKTSYTMPTTWIGLSSTTPALDGTGITEPSGGSYARVPTAGLWNAAAAGVSTNSADIAFATATGIWVSGADLTYGVEWDAATGGNVLAYGALTTPKPVGIGDTFKIPSGQGSVSQS